MQCLTFFFFSFSSRRPPPLIRLFFTLFSSRFSSFISTLSFLTVILPGLGSSDSLLLLPLPPHLPVFAWPFLPVCMCPLAPSWLRSRSSLSLSFLSFLTRPFPHPTSLLPPLLPSSSSFSSSSISCHSLSTSARYYLTTPFLHRPPLRFFPAVTPKRQFQSHSLHPSNMAKRDDMSSGPILSSPSTLSSAPSAASVSGNKPALGSPRMRPANTQRADPSTPVHPFVSTVGFPSIRPLARTPSISSPGGPRSAISQIINDNVGTKGNSPTFVFIHSCPLCRIL